MTQNPQYEINGFSLEPIRNRNETRLVRLLRDLLPTLDGFCGCRVCVEDVYAATLNTLAPRYAQPGSVLIRAEPGHDELRDKVLAAVERVRAHPNHELLRRGSGE